MSLCASSAVTNPRREAIARNPLATLAQPQEFVEYLTEDGIRLPPSFAHKKRDDDSSSDDSSDDDESPRVKGPKPDFPELRDALQAAVDDSDGCGVCPKFSWSTPIDAAWVSPPPPCAPVDASSLF